ncbi:MAG: hypothetical protein QM756_46570 [Polyangiaceae bacterium]
MTPRAQASANPSPPDWSRIDAIADAGAPPASYSAWLSRQAPPTDDYLFSEPRVRFELRDADCPVAPPLEVRTSPRGCKLTSAQFGGPLEVSQVEASVAQRWLPLFDGHTSVAELRERAGDEQPALDALLAGTFGRLVFAPLAVAELEARVSGTELVRFVSTPYEVERAYWENMADVREWSSTLERANDVAAFVRALRRLHVLALLGRSLNNYYRPASRINAKAAQPGALFDAPSETCETPEGTLLLSGARVGAVLVGGRNYQAVVGAHDPESLEPVRSLRDAAGLEWGRLVQGRAPDETETRSWFLPARPLSDAHVRALFDAYVTAERLSRQSFASEAAVAKLSHALARFHYRFVRLHPFRCANQSLSMNLCNGVLLRALSKSMPHGLLDLFALRLSEPAYEIVFERAVRHGALGGISPAQRWATLRQQKADVYALVKQLQGANPAALAELTERNRAAASVALIG